MQESLIGALMFLLMITAFFFGLLTIIQGA